MGLTPTNFVLKAYLTEDNARTDTTPLQVKATSSNTVPTSYVTNGEQLVNFNFFTHTKYWFRIESNEPVNEFYIDWDDGENNNPKGKARATFSREIRFNILKLELNQSQVSGLNFIKLVETILLLV